MSTVATERNTAQHIRRIGGTLVGLLLLIGLVYAGLRWWGSQPAPVEEPTYTLHYPGRQALEATVNTTGSMQPREVLNLNFSISGVVVDVLVDIGQTVRQGEVLARLDTSELDLSVERAEASLAQARATYEQQLAGATPEEIARAQAELAQSQAQLGQTQGNVTAQDIAAAEAQLAEARARLAQLGAGAPQPDRDAALARLERANNNLQSQRDSLSAAKTQAQLQMEQAANAVRDRQTAYSNIYWENRELERQVGANNLAQRSRDREEEALRAVQNAEADLELARIAYEEAQQAEITGIQIAEADVRSAQAELDSLLEGATPDELAAARAQVAQAEATLAQLVGQERASSVAAAQAGVARAQANLEALTTEPRAVDIAAAEAAVREAEVALEQARLERLKAVLRAPIDGTIAEMNLKLAEAPDTTLPDVVLADLTSFYVDVTVDEIDVAQLDVGQDVALTLDALPDLELTGSIQTISPLSTEEAAVTSYNVRITTPASDPRVRAGMSANADITVDRKDAALVVPRRAVRTEGGQLLLDMPVDQSLCTADPATLPPLPELRTVEIETGLRNESVIEVISRNLDEQTCVYIEGVVTRFQPLSGPPPRQRGQ